MASGKDGAEMKFWRTPELVEKLLTFLDAGSTKLLAEAHHLTLEIDPWQGLQLGQTDQEDIPCMSEL